MKREGYRRRVPTSFLSILVLTVLLNFCEAWETPNVILIVADDLGYGDLGCYGNTLNRTPHIDRLAANGLRFTDFHSAGSMCTPTRAAMLTGLYQQRFGRRFEGPLSGKTDRNRGLPLKAVTLAEVLKDRSYATGCFGKWHLGYVPPWLPPSQGFVRYVGLAAGDGDHHTHVDRWGHADWWQNNKLKHEDGYTAELLTKHCVEFIEANRDRPFFVYLPHLAIHFPWQGPEDPPHRRVGTTYEDDKWGIVPNPANVAPHVTAMVESIDKSTGRIIDALTRLALEKRTVVIFTSDNGGYLNYGKKYKNISSNGLLRGQKGTLYEGGHRVPMIVSWPGQVAPGVTDETANSIDLFPTIAGLAGVASKDLKSDGVDLRAVWIERKPLDGRMLFWRDGSEKAVRSGDWKLYVSGEERELYDLGSDLGERRDVADENPRVVSSLSSALSRWENSVDASAQKNVAP